MQLDSKFSIFEVLCKRLLLLLLSLLLLVVVVLLNIANSIPRDQNITLYVDLDMFPSPSIISGDEQRPDIIIKRNNDLWILELSIGFETILEKNRNAKNLRYNTLIQRLKTMYRKVKFINLSLGAIGVYSKSQDTFSDLLSNLEVDKAHSSYVLSKISNVCIRTTNCLLCLKDKDWTDPPLLSW